MKKTIVIIITMILTVSSSCYGNIKADIERLEIAKNKENEAQTIKSPNFYKLPNGQSVNLNDWNLVIFIQSTCQYCIKFDPIIRQVADELGIKTVVFSFDGLSDGNFEQVLPATNEIVANFFRDLPVATPTTFLVNVNDLTTLPVSQGSMKKIEFENQIKKTFILSQVKDVK
ncbi:type-F conjugative transfer system pilin assembly thiol-disulfide isomerase TrbB [Gilliamella sp. BG7]|uniref:type-F conjugative transfer system pilin assembly thiol-disulfide isomerase TrbB n=1 Tax=unclassified Gilliamella TaxID=2685620 RepID=UPI003985A8BA